MNELLLFLLSATGIVLVFGLICMSIDTIIAEWKGDDE